MRTIGFLLATLVSLATTHAAETRPNIVVILADDLGYGDIGAFGQKKLRTPRLDAMAAEGLRFTQFYAGSTVCAPSRAVLLTGRHTGHSAIRGNSGAPIFLEPGTPTVASLLKEAGYATACIGKWHVGSPDKLTNPNDVGFEHFFGYLDGSHAHNYYPEFLIRNGEVVKLENVVGPEWAKFRDPLSPRAGVGVAKERVQLAADLFIDDALRFIREQREGPFFLYFPLNLPHANNEGGDRGMEAPGVEAFAGEDWPAAEKGFAAAVSIVDRQTGQILDLLRELKIAENTVVLFTSDNGPHAEGGHSPEFFDSNGKFRGIKRDLTEGGIRVPTIAWWPGTIKPGGEAIRQWYAGDLLATCAELAGAAPPEDLDSDSFVPALRGEEGDDKWERKSRLYWEFYEGKSSQAVRFGKWKAIRSPIGTGEIELYDLSFDFDERRNHAARRPDLARHAANLLNEQHRPDERWKVKPAAEGR